MAMAYVFSTLTCDQDYHNWVEGGGDMKAIEKTIRIKGGTGLANKNLITPMGVMTEISDQDAELLKKNPVFKIHEENGFVRIEQRSAAPEKVAADMAQRDESAPLTPGDYANTPEDGVQEPEAGGKGKGKGKGGK